MALNKVQKVAVEINESIRSVENELQLIVITKRFPHDQVVSLEWENCNVSCFMKYASAFVASDWWKQTVWCTETETYEWKLVRLV